VAINGFVEWFVDAVVNDARSAADAELLRGDVTGGLAAEGAIELGESPGIMMTLISQHTQW